MLLLPCHPLCVWGSEEGVPWTPAHSPVSPVPWQSRPGSSMDRTCPSHIPKLQCQDDKALAVQSQAMARLPFSIKMDEMKASFSASKQSVVGENISTLLDSFYLLFTASLAGGFAVSCSLWGWQGHMAHFRVGSTLQPLCLSPRCCSL